MSYTKYRSRKEEIMKASKKMKMMGWNVLLMPAVQELDEDKFPAFCDGFLRKLSPPTMSIMLQTLDEYALEMQNKYENKPRFKKEAANLRHLRERLRKELSR